MKHKRRQSEEYPNKKTVNSRLKIYPSVLTQFQLNSQHNNTIHATAVYKRVRQTINCYTDYCARISRFPCKTIAVIPTFEGAT
ncbi:Vitellogenin [Trichinella spiralis]|uniref:Vitellogenin n=1 Tax=Trichinella spiralis TaxID=6334 RepID=A0ABR3L1Q6_TRISP